ncbi:MAG: sigma-54-dependent Fis family transcriptional regulator [Acidobacteria bacterium]|nr:sigma-54-dependent Fis family transcriptional regulator [Acidobacteriota bacterium]
MDTILIVDDDPGFRKLLETILSGEGYGVETAGSVREAVQAGARRKFDLVVSDLKLPDGDGLGVLRWWAENMPGTPVVMITGFGTVATAVEAMKLGAVDYLGKPLSSPDELRLLVRRALDQRQLAEQCELLREEQDSRFACQDLVAGDPKMARLLEMVRRVAPTSATVLITGESGTGKEVVARCIHRNSRRARQVFVPVNCAALSPALIESELFGHEKGSFTGAAARHAGRFERAHGGTLFLDEIGELDPNSQAKLLRVLQERTFERVGGTAQIGADVRVVAATNRNLKQSVAGGKFREDLYYRVSTFPIEIPPLRERPSDISKLASLFLDRAARKLGKPRPALTPAAESVLCSYGWPGNVRELENMMERLAILCDDRIEPADLPVGGESGAGTPRPVLFKDIERQAIEDALRAHGGNRTQAARQLGISLRTLQYRLKEYGIAPPER